MINSQVRASIVTLSPGVRRVAMQDNNAFVKARQLRARQQEMLSTITKLQDEALEVSD